MEIKHPFFSIVIPTKGRPSMLRDAIKSVLWQNFEDFELIVSDNWNDGETQSVLNEFKAHPKFSSIRPKRELNMLDHWEFATKHAKGKYVILLADRKVLYQRALEKVNKAIKKFPDVNVFSFGVCVYNEVEAKLGWALPVGRTRKWFTKDLINNFLVENIFLSTSFDSYFPKTLNGCFRNDFAFKVRDHFGNYFNTKGATTPDFSSFFINCALNDEVVYIGEKLILTQGESKSNGRVFTSGRFHEYMNGLGIKDPYKHVPIKAPFVFNLLIIDFITIKEKFKENLEEQGLDMMNYFSTNYYELLLKKNLGISNDIFELFFNAWQEALEGEGFFLKQEVIIKKAHDQFTVGKAQSFSFNRDMLLAHVRDYLSLRYGADSIWNKVVKFKFNNVHQAAGF